MDLSGPNLFTALEGRRCFDGERACAAVTTKVSYAGQSVFSPRTQNMTKVVSGPFNESADLTLERFRTFVVLAAFEAIVRAARSSARQKSWKSFASTDPKSIGRGLKNIAATNRAELLEIEGSIVVS